MPKGVEHQKAGAVDKGTLAQTRTEQAKIEAKVEVKLAINEAAFADKIAAAIGKHVQDMLKVLDAKFKIEQRERFVGESVRHASSR